MPTQVFLKGPFDSKSVEVNVGSGQFSHVAPRCTREPIRILFVDDNCEFLESAVQFLSAYPQVQVVGRASCGCEAVELVDRLRPDLVLMDLAMPGMSGLEATRQIKVKLGTPRIVIMSLFNTDDYRAAAAAAGADGFLVKSEFVTHSINLIHSLFGDRGIIASDGTEGWWRGRHRN